MSLTNPNTPVSQQDLQDFYYKIKPYLGTDAMPAADMSEIVTPLPSVMSRLPRYSTEEQIVGYWIDGKPIYQKVISATTPTVTAAGESVQDDIDVSELNLDTLIACEGIFSWGTNVAYQATIPQVFLSNDNVTLFIRAYYAKSTNSIRIGVNHQSYGNQPIKLILKYTKTTD